MRRWQLLGIMCAAAALLASACTGSTGSTAAAVGASGSVNPASCKGVTLRFIGLAGEDGKAVTKAFQAKYGMKISETNVADWPTAISAIKVGQPYDLMTVPMWYAQRMIAAGIVRPLDTSKLTEWKNIFPGLAKNSLILGKDGTVYGAPIAWGDGPFVYNPKLVTHPPTSLLELLKPQWKNKYVLFNSDAIMDTLALEDGYQNAPLLTKAQFNVVTKQATTLVKNAQAFTTSYQDGTDRLVSGDAAIDITGWEAMVNFAKAKGVALKYGFYTKDLGGWFDNLGIPTTATHPECALAYINYILQPKNEAALATSLVSGTSNRNAVSSVGKSDKIYNYSHIESIVTPAQDVVQFPDPVPPNSTSSGIMNFQDWSNAWQNITAGR
jgi:putative spermidine/putrescine transport system substrate-binding protein